MITYLKIIKKSALTWFFEIDNIASSLRTISDFEVNIGTSFNIVELDGSNISVNDIENVTVVDETTGITFVNTPDPVVLEQRLRSLNFVPFRDQNSGNGGDSGIIDAPAIAGTGNTVLTFDNVRYHGKTTQTGNISLTLANTGNKNGRVQVVDIDGDGFSSLTFPANWINSNGVSFDPIKNNVIYLDYVNGKIKRSISHQSIPDVFAPIYLKQIITNITLTSAKFRVKINEDGAVKYMVTTNVVAPSKSDILAGVGAVGTNFGTKLLSSNVEQFVDLTGLTNVNHYLWSYAEDSNLNQSVVQVSLSFLPSLSVLASDDFNSPDINNIAGRITPVGSFTWAKFGAGLGTLGIVGNSLKNTGSIGDLDNIYSINLVRNVDVSVAYKTVGTPGYSNLEFARDGNGNRYYLTSGMKLRKVVSGLNTLVSDIGGVLVNGDVVRCQLNDSTIKVYKNGVEVYNGASDSAVVGTNVGIYVYQDGVVEYDNLIIY